MISEVNQRIDVLVRNDGGLHRLRAFERVLYINICTEVVWEIDRSHDLNYEVNSLAEEVRGIIRDKAFRRIIPTCLISWRDVHIKLPSLHFLIRPTYHTYYRHLIWVIHQVGKRLKFIVSLSNELRLRTVIERIIR
jgi:hypothetical protein